MADNYYQDPLGAPDYSAQGMPSLLSLSNLESLGRGSVAGLFDLPYVIEGMLRGDVDPRMPQRKRVVPSSEQVLATTPRMTQPTPQAGLLETAGAFMSPAPVAAVKPVAQAVGKAVKATEGMPVGMSIKPINLSKGIYKPELTMEEMLKVKDIPTVERVRKSIDLVGEKEFEKMVNAQYKKYKPVDQDQEAMLVESVTLDILGRAQRSPYPQQAALDLAQQRAALPVSEGGLGLPANNTPMDRARAMGFDVNTPLYHATDVDFQSIRPSLQGKLGAGVYVSPSSKYAEKYTSLNAAGNARVLPLVARGKLADDDLVMNIAESIRQEMATQNPNFSVSEWKKRTTQALADAGYDGRNMSGLESVITNPDNLRSRFAAFDPFRKDVATATAMGVALPDLLAAEPTPQPQSSGLLFPSP